MPSIPIKAEAQAGRARPHARPEAENRHGDRTPRPSGRDGEDAAKAIEGAATGRRPR